jgi:peptidoglycan hydrolase FlgJ
MQGGVINSITTYAHPLSTRRADPQLAEALTRVPEATQKKIRGQAQDFEAMFLNSMFSQARSATRPAPACGARC